MNQKENVNSQLLIFLRGIKSGEVFNVEDFNATRKLNPSQVSLGLSALVEQGLVSRLGKGVYLKAGADTRLSPEDIIRDHIFDSGGNRKGYLTGRAYLVSAGLAEDYGDRITVAVAKKRGPVLRGGMTFRFVEQRLPINDNTYELLQLLDALRGLNRMHDTVPASKVYEHVSSNVALMSPARVERIINMALSYSHMVRALLGSIIDTTHGISSAVKLMVSLNCTTVTPVDLSSDVLPNAGPWRLVCRE